MTEYSDRELIQMYLNNDTRNYAFNLLVRKYQQRIYWHVRRMLIVHEDTDDVVQEVFIKISQKLGSFRADSALYTWIYRIATNEALTFLNRKRKRFLLPLVDVEKQLSQSLVDDGFFKGDEIQLKLQQAILKLPEKQRLVFNMKYFDELKYEDMSEILGTSVGALKTSYHFASKKIEDFLKND